MPQSAVERASEVRLSDIISALSFALDLTEGQRMGHSARACALGMRMADALQLSREDRSDLYYALLLKDSGCSSNAARLFQIFGGDERRLKRESRRVNWTRTSLETFQYVRRNTAPELPFLRRTRKIISVAMNSRNNGLETFGLRCERGAQIALRMGFSEATAAGIRSLDEHWDGSGYPLGLRGQGIPLFSRIMNLCQTWELFGTEQGPAQALHVLRQRAGRWFDPDLVRIAASLGSDQHLWESLRGDELRKYVMSLEPGRSIHADDDRLDEICEAFAEVIDAKSPFTYRHSRGVARASLLIAQGLGLDPETCTMVRRAALLHDLGKLSVPNSVLDKPGNLTREEWSAIRLHPYYTQKILQRIDGFENLAFVASAHHEKLDGSGYFRGLYACQLTLPARIIAVADNYDALSAARPYREALPQEKVLQLISSEVPHALDGDCFAVLKQNSDVLARTA